MYLGKVQCLNCNKEYTNEQQFEGCPACKTDVFVSNCTPLYNMSKISKDPLYYFKNSKGPGILRFSELLPITDNQKLISLNEGNTPLTRLDNISEEYGINLYAKDETRNPTWSHKDRLNVIAVNKAKEIKASGLVLATTGNHGASGAAYAAKAKMPCIILTVRSAPKTMKVLMQSYGAAVIAFDSYEARWKVMKQCVDNYGWYPSTNYVFPPIGSNCWVNEGYKTVAYELFLQLEDVPDKIIIPVSYGDALFGIWKGFNELKELGVTNRIPEIVAVEVFGPLYKSIKDNLNYVPLVESRPTAALSIASTSSTYQAIKAIKESSGQVVLLDNDSVIMDAQHELASTEGLYCEPSSAAALAGAKELLSDNKIRKNEKIVTDFEPTFYPTFSYNH